MVQPASGSTCPICEMPPKATHSVSEHDLAEQMVQPLLDYVKTDAFSRGDRPLSYADAITRFDVDTSARRLSRVMDAVDCILKTRGWPNPARAGISAYIVNAGSRQPAKGWFDVWNMTPEEARAQARHYLRELILGEHDD